MGRGELDEPRRSQSPVAERPGTDIRGLSQTVLQVICGCAPSVGRRRLRVATARRHPDPRWFRHRHTAQRRRKLTPGIAPAVRVPPTISMNVCSPSPWQTTLDCGFFRMVGYVRPAEPDQWLFQHAVRAMAQWRLRSGVRAGSRRCPCGRKRRPAAHIRAMHHQQSRRKSGRRSGRHRARNIATEYGRYIDSPSAVLSCTSDTCTLLS
jgi:hypothetical protein